MYIYMEPCNEDNVTHWHECDPITLTCGKDNLVTKDIFLGYNPDVLTHHDIQLKDYIKEAYDLALAEEKDVNSRLQWYYKIPKDKRTPYDLKLALACMLTDSDGDFTGNLTNVELHKDD